MTKLLEDSRLVLLKLSRQRLLMTVPFLWRQRILRLLTPVKVSVRCLFKDDQFNLLVWLLLSLLSLFSYSKAINFTRACN